MLNVPRPDLPALRPWFTPERPGPMIFEHVALTGHGRCRVDRWPGPGVVLAETGGGNLALRGDPAAFAGADLAGYVEAEPHWLPALRQIDPATAVWDRLIAVLPDTVEPPRANHDVRRLTAADAALIAALEPEIAWIHATWGGAAGLARAEVGRAAVVDGRAVSIAVPFYRGAEYEDIGVATAPAHRGRGLSTACAAALVADIRARGRRPSWTTSPDNAGSLGVAQRLGFVRQREDVLYVVRAPIPG